MTIRLHTDKEYQRELDSLREQLLLIGAEVEEMIAGSIRALVSRDSRLAAKVIEDDRRVDQIELKIDELALNLLALRQPVASDLRFIAMALKIVRDLERIGDLAVNICERVQELIQEPPLKAYINLPKMAEAVEEMLHQALDSFVLADVERARKVIERDNTIDDYCDQLFRELLTYMMENPRNIYRASRLQSIAKYLERIGDHATNVAEMVIFKVNGQDVRHTWQGEGGGKEPAA